MLEKWEISNTGSLGLSREKKLTLSCKDRLAAITPKMTNLVEDR